MRIAIISPYSCGPMRGNVTTVRRIVHALGELGVETIVLPVDVMSVAEIEGRLNFFAPDLIHAFHAGLCGEPACHQAERLGVPFIITITGSDINDALFRKLISTRHAMELAAAIVCFDEQVAAQVTSFFPDLTGRIAVIPQGVVQLPVTVDSGCVIPDEAFVLLLPAALRPVKNIEFPLRALASLARENDKLLLVIAGGVIDQCYADSVRKLLAGAPFAIWLGDVPYEQMGALYARADVVLNCSHFEGMPNSLLEAMALARPVLAADIPGNLSLVHDNETGWLYRDETGFRDLVTRLMGDVALLAEVGGRAREYVSSKFSTRLEADRYIELYSTLLANLHYPLDEASMKKGNRSTHLQSDSTRIGRILPTTVILLMTMMLIRSSWAAAPPASAPDASGYEISLGELKKVKKDRPLKKEKKIRKKIKSESIVELPANDAVEKTEKVDQPLAPMPGASKKTDVPEISTVPVTINHDPYSYVITGKRTTIQAVISSVESIQTVYCRFRAAEDGAYATVPMVQAPGTLFTYAATLPSLAAVSRSLRYSIIAVDSSGKETRSPEFIIAVKPTTVLPGWQPEHSPDLINIKRENREKPFDGFSDPGIVVE